MAVDTKAVSLAAPLRRSQMGLLTKILTPTGGDLRGAAELGYGVASGWIGALGQAGGTMPMNALRTAQKARYRRLEAINSDTVLQMVSQGLQQVPAGMLTGLPDQKAVDANLAVRMELRGLRARAATGMKWSSNLRGLAGVYAYLQLGLVYRYVQGVIDDPGTPAATREAYLRDFAGLLAAKDELAQASVDGKEQAQAQRQQSAAEEAQLRDELLVADVAAAVENSWPVDQTQLAQAAAAYARVKARAAGTAGTAQSGGVLPEPVVPRGADPRKAAR